MGTLDGMFITALARACFTSRKHKDYLETEEGRSRHLLQGDTWASPLIQLQKSCAERRGAPSNINSSGTEKSLERLMDFHCFQKKDLPLRTTPRPSRDGEEPCNSGLCKEIWTPKALPQSQALAGLHMLHVWEGWRHMALGTSLCSSTKAGSVLATLNIPMCVTDNI